MTEVEVAARHLVTACLAVHDPDDFAAMSEDLYPANEFSLLGWLVRWVDSYRADREPREILEEARDRRVNAYTELARQAKVQSN